MIDNNRVLERIVEEIQGVIARMDENDLERAMALITKGSRIYAAGEGRSGFQARSFAMRMMHIGYTSYMMEMCIRDSIYDGSEEPCSLDEVPARLCIFASTEI